MKKENIHEGHRKRLRERFLAADETYTVDGNFSEHELLELLLFYAQQRVNTNDTAHLLLRQFGSIRGVLEAPSASLIKVKGVGPSTAILIRLVCALMRVYIRSDLPARSDCRLTELSALVPMIRRMYFAEMAEEHIFLMLFNAEGYHIKTIRISDGTPTGVVLDIPRCVRLAIKYEANIAVLVHNHPVVPTPSNEDRVMTEKLRNAFTCVGMELHEHLVLSENHCYAILGDRFL